MTGALLLDLLDGGPDATALLAPGDADALSYAQLAGAVDELADRLAALGIERGDRVALALGPGPEFVELLLAIAALGAAAAPLNPRLQQRRVRLLPRRPPAARSARARRRARRGARGG